MRNTCRLLPRSLLLSLLLSWPAAADIPVLPWQLLRTIPRLPDHFTQGLVYAGPQLFESTGRYGQSRLIAYDAGTLQMQRQYFLRTDVFAEGLTFLDGKLYQSSWKSREIFVYDTGFNLLQTLQIDGDSWGLTTDGHSLIMSNGTPVLQFLDPASGKPQRTLTIRDDQGNPRSDINELEWVNGDILANVWHQDTVLLIDSRTGLIKGQYNFGQLLPELRKHMPFHDGEQVLNGMAWQAQTATLLVTGKDWPVWFELQLTLH